MTFWMSTADLMAAVDGLVSLQSYIETDYQEKHGEDYENVLGYAEDMNAFDTALTALRDMLKRREGCDTCMKGQAMFGDVLWAINRNGKAVININGEQANTVFHHCPMCGRKLEGRQ